LSGLSTFLRVGVPFFQQGNFGSGEKQVKKTLATLLLIGMPAVALAMHPVQEASQEPATTGSSTSGTASSRHSVKHHKRSKNAHHKSAKRHHSSKQHPQAQ
jgi:hypothetical protein